MTPLPHNLLLGAAIVLVVSVVSSAPPVRAATANDWPTYLNGLSRTGFGLDETVITASSAPSMRLRWTAKSAGAESAEPVTVGGVIYWGSWDGPADNRTDDIGIRVVLRV
jgi:hypothetical protein